jgi:hypothetical protein
MLVFVKLFHPPITKDESRTRSIEISKKTLISKTTKRVVLIGAALFVVLLNQETLELNDEFHACTPNDHIPCHGTSNSCRGCQ